MTKPVHESMPTMAQGFATIDAFEGPAGVFCDLIERGRPASSFERDPDAEDDTGETAEKSDRQARDGQLTVYAVARIVFRVGAFQRRSDAESDDDASGSTAFGMPVEIQTRDHQTWTARVRILHEQFGPVLAEITLCGDEVRVRFVVLSGVARDALLAEQLELSECLGEIGLSLVECDVHVGREESSIHRLPVDLGTWEDGR